MKKLRKCEECAHSTRRTQTGMKRTFNAATAAILVLALTASLAGCGLFGSSLEETTTELSTLEETDPSVMDVIEMTEFTGLATETQTAPTAALSTAPRTTTTRATTATQPAATQPPEVTQPTSEATTTTAPAAQASSGGTLKSAVLSPVNSGNYTMSVGISSDDRDVATKYKSGNATAYRVAFPENGFDCHVFESDGKYYLTGMDNGTKKYCELSKSEYDSLCNNIDKAFSYNYNALTYKSSTIELFDGTLQTREEYERADNTTTYVWFKNGAISAVLDKADTTSSDNAVKVSVSSGTDSGLFSIPSDYVEDTQKNLIPACIPFIEMFCS